MTSEEIQAKVRLAQIPFDTAAAIRKLLDDAEKKLGDDYDEEAILELVTE